MDKHKENEILYAQIDVLSLSTEIIKLIEDEPELLHIVYKEIWECLGPEAVIKIYQMYRGQQISFPARLLSPEAVQQKVVQEYDGTNLGKLATKYGYSEKTIRRIIQKKRRNVLKWEVHKDANLLYFIPIFSRRKSLDRNKYIYKSHV